VNTTLDQGFPTQQMFQRVLDAKVLSEESKQEVDVNVT